MFEIIRGAWLTALEAYLDSENFSRRHLRQLRRDLLWAIFLPLGALLLGILVAQIHEWLKVPVLMCGLGFSIVRLAMHSFRFGNVVIGVVIGSSATALQEQRQGSIILNGVRLYATAIAWILSQQIVITFLALLLPVGESFLTVLGMSIAGIGIPLVTFLRGGSAKTWLAICFWLLVGEIVAGALGLMFPPLVRVPGMARSGANIWLEKQLAGPSPSLPFSVEWWWVLAATAAVVAILVLYRARLLGTLLLAAVIGGGAYYLLPRMMTHAEVAGAATINHFEVPLKVSDGWVPVRHYFPACAEYVLNGVNYKNVVVQFTDGREESMGSPNNWEDYPAPDKFMIRSGEATVDIWITNIKRRCRSS